MISEAMPTFLGKDLLMDVQYQKVTEKAKDYELDIVWNLGIGIWDFWSIAGVLNCFNLTGLLSTLTFP